MIRRLLRRVVESVPEMKEIINSDGPVGDSIWKLLGHVDYIISGKKEDKD